MKKRNYKGESAVLFMGIGFTLMATAAFVPWSTGFPIVNPWPLLIPLAFFFIGIFLIMDV